MPRLATLTTAVTIMFLLCSRKALCCKMSVEFDVFLESGKK
jgi:hypothetical protein